METLGGHRTHCDHSVCTMVHGAVTGPGMGMWVRPGHWGLVLRLCWVLLGRRLELVNMVISLDLPGTATGRKLILRMEQPPFSVPLHGEGHRDEKWTDSFDGIPSAPQSTDSGIPETLLDLVNKSFSSLTFFFFPELVWMGLSVTCTRKKNLDWCANDYIFFSLVDIRISKCRKFPGGPVGRTVCLHCRRRGLKSWSGN